MAQHERYEPSRRDSDPPRSRRDSGIHERRAQRAQTRAHALGQRIEGLLRQLCDAQRIASFVREGASPAMPTITPVFAVTDAQQRERRFVCTHDHRAATLVARAETDRGLKVTAIIVTHEMRETRVIARILALFSV